MHKSEFEKLKKVHELTKEAFDICSTISDLNAVEYRLILWLQKTLGNASMDAEIIYKDFEEVINDAKTS